MYIKVAEGRTVLAARKAGKVGDEIARKTRNLQSAQSSLDRALDSQRSKDEAAEKKRRHAATLSTAQLQCLPDVARRARPLHLENKTREQAGGRFCDKAPRLPGLTAGRPA